MTSKEYSEKLFKKYKNLDIDYNDSIEGDCFMCMNKSDAKQCALIAVDEILYNCYEVMKPFWEEVKLELNKL